MSTPCTDDERSELISRNVNRTRSVPLAQPKRTKRTTENPRRVNSEIVRDPQDAFIVRPTAPPNSAPQTSNHHHLPRINVEATHNRPANLSRRVQTSSSRPGKNNNDDKAPPVSIPSSSIVESPFTVVSVNGTRRKKSVNRYGSYEILNRTYHSQDRLDLLNRIQN